MLHRGTCFLTGKFTRTLFGCLFALGISCGLTAAPMVDPVATVQVPAGKSRILPLTATSPEGIPLTYTVTSSAPDQIGVIMHTSNPWMKMGVEDFGVMTFQLLRDRAPNTVNTIGGFVQSGFYQGLTFHRIISDFMIQGGDPLGTGKGGPAFRFDDEFHPLALFTGFGQLAMANSGKDSNGSQFFITVSSPRPLDFNHTIFGQLVRGFNVLTNLASVATDTNDHPKSPVVITNAMLCTNTTDAVITLVASNGPDTEATITVQVTDGLGGQASTTFAAQRVSETVDDPPILGPATNVVVPVDTMAQITTSSMDLEGNAVSYGLDYDPLPVGTAGGLTNNVLTVIPPAGYSGPMHFYLGVKQVGAVSRGSTANPYDIQPVTIAFGDTVTSATGVEFLASTKGTLTNQVVATFTNANASRPASDFQASIKWGDGTLDTNTLIQPQNGGPGFEVLGTHQFASEGTHPIEVTVSSKLGGSTSAMSSAVIPPAVALNRQVDYLELTWPAWAYNYQVQTRTNLSSSDWEPLNQPPVVNGFENMISNLAPAGDALFRLKR